MHAFVENVIIFVKTTPIGIKPCNMIGTRLRAKFRRRMTRRLGGKPGHRQNNQTLKYLVDLML